MTNHGETTGPSENDGVGGRNGNDGWASYGSGIPHQAPVSYDGHLSCDDGPAAHQVTLRTPAELADALPYLLGYRPEDSIVLVALHDRGGRGRFGGRARLGIPAGREDWPAAARQLAQGLVKGGERRGARPAQVVAYLCQDPAKGWTGRQVREHLEPLAKALQAECGELGVPVIEALCISGGRFWSYCCGDAGCCPVEGTSMGLPGTSVLAAAATYAGIQVRGTLRELRERLQPLETSAVLEQEVALDTVALALVPRILEDGQRAVVAEETINLAARLMRRLADSPTAPRLPLTDRQDDDLITPDEAAALILGLQDRETRDRAAAWMEGDDAAPALRLWRALARRCVGPYGEHAAAPLTLAGWVAWSSGDELEAMEALAMAMGADPDYLFARLLHQACNEGLDPESVRRCLRVQREGGGRRDDTGPAELPRRAASIQSGDRSAPNVEAKDCPEGGPKGSGHDCGPEPSGSRVSTAARRRRRARADGDARVAQSPRVTEGKPASGATSGPRARASTRPVTPRRTPTRPRPLGTVPARRLQDSLNGGEAGADEGGETRG